MKLCDTPITQHQFDGTTFYLKRDDQLHSHFSGNKARKFMTLLEGHYPDVTTLISYGSAQANSLYSLAALCAIKGWSLEFYVDHIPQWLVERPIGNYRGALDLGASIIPVNEISLHPAEFIKAVRQPDSTCLVVEEGGRSTDARLGIEQLAREILSWTRFETGKEFVVALPSGTGTTALYLHRFLKLHGIDVLTCPCVGGKDYLIEQFKQLGETDFPQILELENKHHFGKLYRQDYEIWRKLLEQTNVEFDLLYDPMMWQCLQSWSEENPEKTIIYVHQGGLLGNESMLPRYQRKFGD
ncbi:1-aminocyclopropane-1-carboxylate deaminase/D-cysteine desulfhydrase [Vibrio coralliilyticus]|uniref:1-aminocyclopropane-1-carboxylate deaminase/D-cysteine desulfhydrase n=1 Tax=Vibrio coralliilyticus TaxID=190893 RepID=UPI0006CCF245|nr:1-aminocyclopropane-1-carboxylate deaminase/D-cysteine desulfhydrase [Vibrio coralliilyticus]AXN30966.1 1-aminocyclopropane-1-carboxylate deaminase/D-cysteine desulfhydrase [Vibrio coralliilyticus]KPH27347.1 1-aminocyclopropane-1-carboxylate deaminase [Vibrio coralliilyticus]